MQSSPSWQHYLHRAAVTFVVVPIRFYQTVVSPHLIGSCKFCPTCSEYFVEAVERYGPWRGARLGVWRLLRCVPFTRGGYDPVP
jgi:putative membrane protein insertion efficiency factor